MRDFVDALAGVGFVTRNGLSAARTQDYPTCGGLVSEAWPPDAETSDLGSIAEIYSRNWFRRSWVIQEVALASGIVVFCGEKSTSWRELSLLADNLGFLGLLPLIKESYEDSVDTSLLGFLCSIKKGRSSRFSRLDLSKNSYWGFPPGAPTSTPCLWPQGLV